MIKLLQKFSDANMLWDQLVCYFTSINVYSSMADKQLKRRLYFLCYWCFYTQYSNEKDKVNTIIYFIVCFTKQTWLKYVFLHRKFDFRLAKIRFSFWQHLISGNNLKLQVINQSITKQKYFWVFVCFISMCAFYFWMTTVYNKYAGF